jgi:hypothetical protein
MSFVGINIGALTVKVVAIRANAKDAKTTAHQGRPLEVLEELLADPDFADAEYFGVSGHLGHISEFAAIQRMRPAKYTVDGAWGGRLGYFTLLAA